MTYIDSLDRGCQNDGCWATWTAGETHECRFAPYSISEEVVGYQRVRRPQQQERRASDFIDWRELIASFVVALLLTAAGIAVYFWMAASQVPA